MHFPLQQVVLRGDASLSGALVRSFFFFFALETMISISEVDTFSLIGNTFGFSLELTTCALNNFVCLLFLIFVVQGLS